MSNHRIEYVRDDSLMPAFTKGGVRCLRIRGAGGKPGERYNVKYSQIVPGSARAWLDAKVYQVRFITERTDASAVNHGAKTNNTTIYCTFVALSEKALVKELQRIGVKRAKRYMGAAQYAMKLAQQAVSTRHVADPARMGEFARKLAEGNLRIRSFGGDSEWTVLIEDSLAYAANAFKRSDAVEFAMAKAANSIAGMLRKRAGDLLDPSLATPFPEIAQHRRTA